MTRDCAPQLDRKVVQLPDGRQLIYYPFPGADAPQPKAVPPPPPRQEP